MMEFYQCLYFLIVQTIYLSEFDVWRQNVTLFENGCNPLKLINRLEQSRDSKQLLQLSKN